MIGAIKGTMRQKKEVNGLPLPIASYKAHLKAPIRSLKVAITAKQSGSGTPAPDNIRPISGWSECNVVRCGKNILNQNNGVVAAGNPRFKAYGVDNFSDTVPNGSVILSAGTYAFSLTSADSIKWESLAIFDDTNTRVSVSYNANSFTFTLTRNCAYKISISIKSDVFTSWDDYDLQLELGSTATAYEAYNGNTYTIQLGDTYYGGSLDVTNGVLTVTDARDKLKNLSWIYQSVNTRFYSPSISDTILAPASNYDYPEMLCECYDPHSLSGARSGNIYVGLTGNLFVMDSGYTDSTTWLTSVGDYYLLYKLKTPITIQLTPTQIEQLLGVNNVFADTGDVEELEHTDRQVYYGR